MLKLKNLKNYTLSVLFGALILVVFSSTSVSAEGTHQMNEMQYISSSTDVYVDILNAGEVINVSFCDDQTISIYDINGTPADLGDDTLLDSNLFTANLNCSSSLPNPILNAYKYTPPSTGTYRIDFDNSSDRYDFTVTPNTSTEPDPTANNGGRVWSYLWRLSAIDSNDPQEYPESTSTDANLYAVVPAPTPGENFIWLLDLNNFAGGSYRILANSIGLDAPYSGVSAWMDNSSVTPEYPIYLSYPEDAGNPNTTQPNVSSLSFTDDDGEDDTFSPGSTIGVQDTGVFTFTSNVDNATYAITIDTNKDGQYGTGDRVLIGSATNGVNTVTWDGNYANGNPVPEGNYSARLQLRIGEFHFVARDVEASGGTYDNQTWANGLTIYRATGPTTQESVRIFWDDVSVLRVVAEDEDYNEYLTDQLYSDATSNLPDGVMSGSTADLNNDGKADGFHTWGDFEELSMGDRNYIDTYTYGAVDSAITTLSVAGVDGTDDDGISSGVEAGAPNNGDGNNDGTSDHLQDDVTSLPNPVTGNGTYNTVQVTGCSGLSNVSIQAESELSSQDDNHDYPVGLFNFDISCLSSGATAEVTIFYDKLYDTSSWQARKFINGSYGVISGAAFGTANIGGAQVTTLTYSATDGGDMDEDGTANGTIVDPAGPGVAPSASSTGAVNLAETGDSLAILTVVSVLLLALSTQIALTSKRTN